MLSLPSVSVAFALGRWAMALPPEVLFVLGLSIGVAWSATIALIVSGLVWCSSVSYSLRSLRAGKYVSYGPPHS